MHPVAREFDSPQFCQPSRSNVALDSQGWAGRLAPGPGESIACVEANAAGAKCGDLQEPAGHGEILHEVDELVLVA